MKITKGNIVHPEILCKDNRMILREQREQRCSGWIGMDTWMTSDAQFTDYSECFFDFPQVDQFSMTPH